MSDWFHRAEDNLRRDWQRAERHFRHATPSISGERTQPPQQQEPAMSLKTILDEGTALLEDGESKVRTFLDQHVPQLTVLADLIETNPIFASVEGALHVPPEILNGFAKALDALASAYPKPAEAAPAVGPEQPAEPQPAEQSAA